jgi:hypothetical protein
MPLYDDEEDNILKVEFGDGKSLSLTKREGYGSAETFRKLIKVRRTMWASGDRKRILQGKIDAETNLEELEKLQTKMEAEEKNSDEVSALVDVVFDSFCGWDSFAKRSDAETKPFTKENIAKIHFNRLKLIVQKVSDELTREDADPKALLNESKDSSSLANTVQ